MSVALAPYNVSLAATSPLFQYTPSRDGDVTTTWNASYTGRDVWPALVDTTRPAGVGYRRTQSEGAKVALSFEGEGLYVCFTANDATFILTVDGQLVKQPNAAQFVPADNNAGPCKGFGAESMFSAPGLEPGTHSMLLTVAAASDQEFRFFGGMITLGVNTKGHDVTDSNIIDDQDAGWALSGGRTGAQGGTWDTATGATLFDSTSTFQCNYGTGSTASYKFSGAGGVILRGNIWNDSHSFSVSLDGTNVNMDAASSWEDGSAVFFAQGNLDPAAIHTITVTDYSSDDDGCTNGKDGKFRFCCLGLDALVLLEAGTNTIDVPSSPTSTGGTAPDDPDNHNETDTVPSSKSIAGPVAGGVVGGLALVGILIFALWFYRRRKKGAIALASAPVDGSQFVARPWEGDTDYGMRYASQGSSGAILSSSDAYASPNTTASVPFGTGRARPGEKQLPPAPPSRPAASSTAETRSTTESSASGMAPADLERVLAFVAQRMDQQRPAGAAPPEERPPQYQG